MNRISLIRRRGTNTLGSRKAVGSPGRSISPSTRVVKKTPLDQMPAATPEDERLDEAPVKAIHSTIKNKLINPVVTVRTGSRRTLPLAALARAPPV